MTSALVKKMSKEEARKRIHELLRSVEMSSSELESRAYRYDLSDREAAVWEEVSELEWLLGE